MVTAAGIGQVRGGALAPLIALGPRGDMGSPRESLAAALNGWTADGGAACRFVQHSPHLTAEYDNVIKPNKLARRDAFEGGALL